MAVANGPVGAGTILFDRDFVNLSGLAFYTESKGPWFESSSDFVTPVTIRKDLMLTNLDKCSPDRISHSAGGPLPSGIYP